MGTLNEAHHVCSPYQSGEETILIGSIPCKLPVGITWPTSNGGELSQGGKVQDSSSFEHGAGGKRTRVFSDNR
jgi:hypothetical protein